jgi:hypothetical protein
LGVRHPTNLAANSVVARNHDHPSTELDGEVIILQQKTGNYLGLNEVASDVWRWLATPSTPQDLCARVARDYGIDAELALSDVLELLQHMHAEGLITIDA